MAGKHFFLTQVTKFGELALSIFRLIHSTLAIVNLRHFVPGESVVGIELRCGLKVGQCAVEKQRILLIDIKTDYTLESVDPEWLKQGVKSPKHLMLDPEPCILCRACEDVCPWNCIYMLDPGIVQRSEDDSVEQQVDSA